jgi:sigma-E factor negative regulatory protein RseA
MRHEVMNRSKTDAGPTMDTNKKNREHISALSDGETPEADLELAMAALGSPDGQGAWETYHRIGDILRAEATPDLSAGFSERLAVRAPCGRTPAGQAVRNGTGSGGCGRRDRRAALASVAGSPKPRRRCTRRPPPALAPRRFDPIRSDLAGSLAPCACAAPVGPPGARLPFTS